MTPEILLFHLYELGVTVELSPDARSLVLDAPAGVMTRELTDWIRQFKPELVQLVYEEKEREAIQWEGSRLNTTPRVRDREADKRLAKYLQPEDTRVVVGGVPQWEPQHAANF